MGRNCMLTFILYLYRNNVYIIKLTERYVKITLTCFNLVYCKLSVQFLALRDSEKTFFGGVNQVNIL